MKQFLVTYSTIRVAIFLTEVLQNLRGSSVFANPLKIKIGRYIWIQNAASGVRWKAGKVISRTEQPLNEQRAILSAKGTGQEGNVCCVYIVYNASAWTRKICSGPSTHKQPSHRRRIFNIARDILARYTLYVRIHKHKT